MKRNPWLPVLALSCLCLAAAVPPAAADDPPLANFYGNCVSPRLCAVDAEASSDDGYITNYHWNWGDGTSTNGTKSDPSHTYAVAGTYTITLTITDNANQTDVYSLPFQVPN
ncbi:MAG TPA: PKD domain-containing protein [Thermoanaerobaculia bacterium]|nr:PKD domain-containing protein [Thermoanaerobaculia bacterium]